MEDLITAKLEKEATKSLSSSRTGSSSISSLSRSIIKDQLSSLKSASNGNYKENLSTLLSSMISNEQDIRLPSNNSTKIKPSLKLHVPEGCSVKIPPKPEQKARSQVPEYRIGSPKAGHRIGSPKAENRIGSPRTENKERSQILSPLKQSTSISLKRPDKLEPIHSVSNLVSKIVYQSQPSRSKNLPGYKNQDKLKILTKLNNTLGLHLLLLADGHGSQGGLISDWVLSVFSNNFQQVFPASLTEEKISKAFYQSIESTSNELNSSGLDSVFSGASFLSLLINGSTLFCASLGGCKAIVCQETDKLYPICISTEHLLSNKNERKRLRSRKARIVKSQNMYGIRSRIFYTQKEDFPGLDLTRSFGDKLGKTVGMLSDPELITYNLKENDRFIILGTENFWKAFSPDEAIKVAQTGWLHGSADEVCSDLMFKADKKLMRKYGIVDDLTVIVVFL